MLCPECGKSCDTVTNEVQVFCLPCEHSFSRETWEALQANNNGFLLKKVADLEARFA